MEVGTFSFGKYRGWPSCDVPVEYLVWALEKMASPPAEVLAELQRRAARLGSRDAITAQAVLGGLSYKKARRTKRKARKQATRSQPNRTGLPEIVGVEFRASREAYPGDLSECPF
jgi:hypothetical protein